MKKIKSSDVFIAFLVLAIVMLMLLPISTGLLDFLLIINIAMSLMVLLLSLYVKDILEMAIFPTLLLIMTLFRLSLNLSSTKLILGNSGQAGNVIETFGNFVGGGDLVVGTIVFVLIVLVQFIVITKGSERVAEVSARFTLDAMPGKQMAIDADLNTGIIDEATAQERRKNIQRTADFYGAMDGASKFVKGDAIMGIVITLVNVVGGLIIGSANGVDNVVEVYLIATIGDGLVSQIPALLISTAAGIIVTRSANENSFGQDMTSQLFGNSSVLLVLAAMVLLIGFIPGMPTLITLVIAAGIAFFAYTSLQKEKKKEQEEALAIEDAAEAMAKEKRKPESVTSLLQVDLIEMEFGYGIISLVDASQGGDLLDRVVMIRRQCALELGVIVPVVRLRDNIQLGTNSYSIKIKGLEVASGKIMLDHYMALRPAEVEEPIEGIETVDPAFGLPAVWVTENVRDEAELKGYTTIDAPSVIATHLMEVIKKYAHELLGRQQVQVLIDNLKTQQPALVDEALKLFSIGELQKVLANLLRESISIRDLASILEILCDYGTVTRDLAVLTEYVRQGLRRSITKKFVPTGVARVITLDPTVEQLLSDNIRQSDQGSYVSIDPMQMQRVLRSVKNAIDHCVGMGVAPVFLTSPRVRRYFKQITDQLDTDLVVLSFNELDSNVEIFSDGVVTL